MRIRNNRMSCSMLPLPPEVVSRCNHFPSRGQCSDDRFLVEEVNRLIKWSSCPLRKLSDQDTQAAQLHDQSQLAPSGETKSLNHVEQKTGKEDYKLERPGLVISYHVYALGVPNKKKLAMEAENQIRLELFVERELPLKKRRYHRLKIERMEAGKEERPAAIEGNANATTMPEQGVNLDTTSMLDKLVKRETTLMPEKENLNECDGSQRSKSINCLLNQESSLPSPIIYGLQRQESGENLFLGGMPIEYEGKQKRRRGRPKKGTGHHSKGALALTAGGGASPWLSPSGDFAFGFQQLENKDLFLLSVWCEKIPEKTIVWYANGDNPAPSGSKVELTADHGLVSRNPTGEQIWSSNITNGQVSRGVMEDTGNFVLQNGSHDVLWQSFDHPTDTLLPTQSLEIGGVLFSRRTETNFSQGRFQLRLLEDGNLLLNPINLETKLAYDAYYVSRTSDTRNSSNSGYRLVFNAAGALYILKRGGDGFFLSTVTVPAADFYQRATLNFDGVFAQYSYPKRSTGSTNWSTIFTQPENICTAINGTLGSGACGYNSICSLNDKQRPACTCPQGFSLLDSNDEHGNCKPDSEVGCEGDWLSSMEDSVDFVELNNTDWPKSDYELLRPSREEECRNSCLHDCLCAVAIFRGSSCSKKKLPLSNGRLDRSVDGRLLSKLKNIILFQARGKLEGCNHRRICSLGEGSLWKQMCIVLHTKSLQELQMISSKNLEEGHLVLFTREMQIGSISAIAVKELNDLVQNGEKEFKTEVHVIGRTQHKNLVQLIGFCDEGHHRLLVYEYLSKGTLAQMLFGKSKPSWSLRIEMASGIARGLLYLHEECSNTPIIHCDIKPQNILIDDKCNARISDFGLSKLLMMDQSHTRTTIRGTRGYIAPEWFMRTPITVKVDVYSFGVTLLEIVYCRRSVYTETDGEEMILIDWAYDSCREGTLHICWLKMMSIHE
ncbi:hypothetical protein GH714_001301 [Hevea brasiliensis]|uniref:non-specific serine/threonine protein kinase n=1 Tax=Hevea brasiliensis TaxID=3981 RepID=A0A6A6M9S1_HEVBR|nr:hypothetical protein GH714_001301 [Hevea brasiliensis]